MSDTSITQAPGEEPSPLETYRRGLAELSDYDLVEEIATRYARIATEQAHLLAGIAALNSLPCMIPKPPTSRGRPPLRPTAPASVTAAPASVTAAPGGVLLAAIPLMGSVAAAQRRTGWWPVWRPVRRGR